MGNFTSGISENQRENVKHDASTHKNGKTPPHGETDTSKILDYPDVLGSPEEHDVRRHLRHGYWMGKDTQKLYSRFSEPQFSEELPKFLKQENCTSVIDIGAGNGTYTEVIAKSGIFVNCYDGNPDTQSISGGRCAVLDFSQAINLPCQYDWVLSLKVGKHIPKEFEETFFQNMHSLNRKGVIINWGGGTEMTPFTAPDAEYFNQKPDSYIVEKFIQLGYTQDLKAQQSLRNAATQKTLRDRLLVFRKTESAHGGGNS